jgi:hypothetical protein
VVKLVERLGDDVLRVLLGAEQDRQSQQPHVVVVEEVGDRHVPVGVPQIERGVGAVPGRQRGEFGR